MKPEPYSWICRQVVASRRRCHPHVDCFAPVLRGDRPAGFTLLELLVVIAILGILSALLLPALSKGKQKAEGVLCLNAGKQMMLAMTLYTGDNTDFFPPQSR